MFLCLTSGQTLCLNLRNSLHHLWKQAQIGAGKLDDGNGCLVTWKATLLQSLSLENGIAQEAVLRKSLIKADQQEKDGSSPRDEEEVS